MLGIRHKIPKVRNGATAEQVNLFRKESRQNTQQMQNSVGSIWKPSLFWANFLCSFKICNSFHHTYDLNSWTVFMMCWKNAQWGGLNYKLIMGDNTFTHMKVAVLHSAQFFQANWKRETHCFVKAPRRQSIHALLNFPDTWGCLKLRCMLNMSSLSFTCSECNERFAVLHFLLKHKTCPNSKRMYALHRSTKKALSHLNILK